MEGIPDFWNFARLLRFKPALFVLNKAFRQAFHVHVLPRLQAGFGLLTALDPTQKEVDETTDVALWFFDERMRVRSRAFHLAAWLDLPLSLRCSLVEICNTQRGGFLPLERSDQWDYCVGLIYFRFIDRIVLESSDSVHLKTAIAKTVERQPELAWLSRRYASGPLRTIWNCVSYPQLLGWRDAWSIFKQVYPSTEPDKILGGQSHANYIGSKQYSIDRENWLGARGCPPKELIWPVADDSVYVQVIQALDHFFGVPSALLEQVDRRRCNQTRNRRRCDRALAFEMAFL